jgi:hypothetical protein
MMGDLENAGSEWDVIIEMLRDAVSSAGPAPSGSPELTSGKFHVIRWQTWRHTDGRAFAPDQIEKNQTRSSTDSRTPLTKQP